MAIFNEILSGRFNRSLQKYFAIKATAPVRQLAGEVQPVHALATGIENRYLEGWNRFGASILVGAVAAQNSVIQLSAKVGQNFVAVIEKCFILPGAADLILLEIDPTINDLSTQVNGFQLDQRQVGASQAIMSGQNNVGAINVFFGIQVPATGADVILTDDQEIVLVSPTPQLQGAVGSGNGFRVRTQAVNESLRVSFVWRERLLEESERF